MKKIDNIISAVASQVEIKSMKYVIMIPVPITGEYELDMYNVNITWRYVISQEMENVLIAFDMLEDGNKSSAAHKRVFPHDICHQDGLDKKSKTGCRSMQNTIPSYEYLYWCVITGKCELYSHMLYSTTSIYGKWMSRTIYFRLCAPKNITRRVGLSLVVSMLGK